nr:APH [uncultured bacterium]
MMKEKNKMYSINKKSTARELKLLLQTNFQELVIDSLHTLGEGWMSRAFLVNNQIVFRLPKNHEGALDTKKEINILPTLINTLSLEIPDFLYIGEQENGFPFVGYNILSGEPLDEQLFLALPREIKNFLARQLAQFMNEINSYDVPTAKSFSVPEKNFRQHYQAVFQEAKVKLFPLLDNEEQEEIIRQFEQYLGKQANFSYTPKLTHSDISLNHLMYDSKNEKLTGIIDFGDLQIGDPDFEYIYLLEECGEDLVVQIMENRQVENISHTLEKIHFFTHTDNVIQFLEGLKRNDKAMMDEALFHLKAHLKNALL